MEKIVIFSKEGGNDYGLVELLNRLFPECEICTVIPKMKGLEVCPNGSSSDFPVTDAGGDNHGKSFDRG